MLAQLNWKKEYNDTVFSLDRWEEFIRFFQLNPDEHIKMKNTLGNIVVVRIGDIPTNLSRQDVQFALLTIQCLNANIDIYFTTAKRENTVSAVHYQDNYGK